MKKAFLLLALLASCSSSSEPSDPTALTAPIAQNVTISEIAILQALKVPVMQGGTPADRGTLPLVAQRDSILRVYVTPESGFSPHSLTARARIVTTSPTGTQAQVFSATAVVTTPSQEFDLTSTINIPIPGLALERGSSVTVVLNDTTGDPPSTPSSNARWPQDGSLADLDVRDGGDRVRVMIVPVQYDADGSHRLPDTSDAQIEAYRKHFYQLYPTANVEITVRDPWPWSSPINGSGAGMGQLLQALGPLRSSDQPDPDVYYYAAFAATNDFGSYCGGGCITGLSLIGVPTSVGIGYSGDVSTGTAVHEVGHAHGRQHAPCGGAGSPDPNYPYAGGLIGVWGYDPFAQAMVNPANTTDMMSYCAPTWISDYHYALIFNRVRTDNKYYNDWMSNHAARGVKPYVQVPVGTDATVHASTAATREPWITEGEPREVTWSGGKATAYFFAYDHLPGGVLYMPADVPSGSTTLHEGVITTILR
jgi:hypothetical protein